MAITRVPCPECGAGLKSSAGFTLGQNVCCPKCETYFTVKESAAAAAVDDEDFPTPGGKKQRLYDDAEWSYKNSPLRYAILGLLIAVMIGLGAMLYLKKRDDAWQPVVVQEPPPAEPPEKEPTAPLVTPTEGPIGAGVGGGRLRPKGTPGAKGKQEPKIGGKETAVPVPPGGTANPLVVLAAKQREFSKQLVGTWEATLGKDSAVLEYREDGTFTDTITIAGKEQTISGRWKAQGLVPDFRGLVISRVVDGKSTAVRAIFENGELLHDTQERGTIGVFRKK